MKWVKSYFVHQSHGINWDLFISKWFFVIQDPNDLYPMLDTCKTESKPSINADFQSAKSVQWHVHDILLYDKNTNFEETGRGGWVHWLEKEPVTIFPLGFVFVKAKFEPHTLKTHIILQQH